MNFDCHNHWNNSKATVNNKSKADTNILGSYTIQDSKDVVVDLSVGSYELSSLSVKNKNKMNINIYPSIDKALRRYVTCE